MVVFDRVSADLVAPKVKLDNAEGGWLAGEHLVEQGYKRIAVLAGPKNLAISNERLEGCLKALKRHKIKMDPSHLIHCGFNQQNAFEATMDLLRSRTRPDAIFTISDRMAIGAMLAIKEKGTDYAQGYCLVGSITSPLQALLHRGISSVEQPAFEIGKRQQNYF
jgi:LacI family transcriptional regulator